MNSSSCYMQDNNQMDTRKRYLDIARGIGLSLVVLGHLMPLGLDISFWIFSFHMPLFFFISGCCFNPDKYNGWLKFIIHKAKTILLPYVIFVLLGFLISNLIPSWRANISSNTIREVLYDFKPETLHVGQLWFLGCLFIVEVIFYLLQKLIKKHIYLYSIVLIVLLTIIGNKVHTITVPHFGRPPIIIAPVCIAIVFYLIGYLAQIKNIFQKLYARRDVIMLFALCLNILFGVLLNGSTNFVEYQFGNMAFYYISALSGIVFIVMLSICLKESMVYEYIGRNSLVMFSCHSFFLYLSAYVLSLITKQNYSIMQNIPLFYSIIISLLIILALYPVTLIYNYIQKLIKQRNKA